MHARSYGLGGQAAVFLLLAGLTPAPAQDAVYGSAAAEIIWQTEGTMLRQSDQVRVTSARVILALPNVDVGDRAGADTRSGPRDLTNALVKTGRAEWDLGSGRLFRRLDLNADPVLTGSDSSGLHGDGL